ncbi:cyclic nucleotide-binding domain-containing protein [Gemmata sp. G18]|uniref:Cyclic nucleotide-binding domain-containing protein n=1 Tax=Gemmata palustris TaxID=2822762 RepID=A0ABS5BX81_9BACT|nr:cyclic nucleotide-binding domain-containing protein [Gemmata palustris]MBP3957478.1 cyclic nucleotide-binding domain-containing protein [Gemmata palustris]
MPDFADPDISLGREEESLFARDDNDVLVRREKETRDRFNDLVTIVIDGYAVEVPRAVPKTDSQGNVLRDPDGKEIPRTTTIYDAAAALVEQGAWSDEELKTRIPVLCHQRHVAPVAVCRMCSVHISSMKRGKLTAGRKLVPACQHRVETNMVVTTRAGLEGYNPEKRTTAEEKVVERAAGDVNSSIRMLAEFLVADHCHEPLTPTRRYEDELSTVARSLGVIEVHDDEVELKVRESLRRAPELPSRNTAQEAIPKSRRIELPLLPTLEAKELNEERSDLRPAWEEWNALIDDNYPYSSRTVVVDHDRCILCDRCVRACSEVKPFKVIGHTGKGYGTRISFDLDSIMRDSTCVQCGECMNSCPTGALSLRRRVRPRAWEDSPEQIPVNPNTSFPKSSGFLTADEMLQVWLLYESPTRGPRVVFPFRSIPYSYLKWNEGAVRKWEIAPGEKKVLCEEGEYGSTAFLLQGSGTFEIYVRGAVATQKPGFFASLFGKKPSNTKAAGYGDLVKVAMGNELVLGEMTCVTQRPRVASVIGVAEDDNRELVLGADENGWPTATPHPTKSAPVVVYEITRNMLDMMQRAASAREDIQEMYTLRAIQTGVQSGRLFQLLDTMERQQAVTFLLTEGVQFGRVAAGETIIAEGDTAAAFYIIRLGTVRVFTTAGGGEQVLRILSVGDGFGEAGLLSERPGIRTATIAALDPVEVVRVPGPVFRKLCDRFPALKEGMKTAPRPAVPGVEKAPPPAVLRDYVRQGLYQGQKLLVLDLKSCTRCDECTRACADSHDGNARLLREGLRFGDFLVATSCRSCHKPYCMEGCPVDAIHRRGNHLEVVIENHCIGCGLCERNCPYGAIHMVPRGTPNPAAAEIPGGNPHMTAARRAVNCDLCNGDEPYCVQACPHEAAYRKTGPALLDEILHRLDTHD